LKIWGSDVYVTVPRWMPGVPSTLNKLVKKNGSVILTPFPNIESQIISNATGIKNTQSMEIDQQGRMWIIDTGMMNLLDPSIYIWNTPKLIVMDLKTNTVLKTYQFPESIAKPNMTFLNDIVVDTKHMFAYISNSAANGGIYIYDYKRNVARLWVDQSTEAESGGNVYDVVGGGNYTRGYTPSDGIALSHDYETLYYSPLSGWHMYSLPTSLLRNFSVTDEQLHNAVVPLGKKLSQSDGLAMASNGILYYGNIHLDALNFWNSTNKQLTNKNQKFKVQSTQGMQWQDTFAFDNKGYLYFTSNRLQQFPDNMSFTGQNGANFHIWKVFINANSYLWH